MQRALRILMTNNTLANRAGSEVYIRDLAIALMKRGHFPITYSTVLGGIAEDLRQATIPVISSLEELIIPPDIIHGQHHLETMSAMLHFNDTPAIFICHGWEPWPEIPPVFPRVRQYVAVDDLCRERIYTTPGIRPEQVEVLYNFVDLSRFAQRPGLPERASKALVFSNYVSEGSEQLKNIRMACTRMGISQVDVVGSGSGNIVVRPETILPGYDVVFAKARCALEALACGCAVVITDVSGLGGLVTTENMQRMRALNFGNRAMQARTVSVENVMHELEKYDAEDTGRVSDWIRQQADLEITVDHWIRIYEKTLNDWKKDNQADWHSESRAAAGYIHFLSGKIKETNRTLRMKKLTGEELDRQKKLNDELREKNNALVAELEAAKRSGKLSEEKLTRQKTLIDDLQKKLLGTTANLEAIQNARTWRLFNPYRKIRSWMKRGVRDG